MYLTGWRATACAVLAAMVFVGCGEDPGAATPKEAIGKVLRGVNQRDPELAMSAVTGTENEMENFKALVRVSMAHLELTDAVADEYGEDAKDKFPANDAPFVVDDVQARLDKIEIERDGDTATASMGRGASHLVKEDGRWYLSLSEGDAPGMPNLPDRQKMQSIAADAFNNAAEVLEEAREKVGDDGVTPASLAREINTRMQEAMRPIFEEAQRQQQQSRRNQPPTGYRSASANAPQSRSEQAGAARKLKQQVQTVRSQIELYKIQHDGEAPDLGAGWKALTTKQDGFGPYLRGPLNNPLARSSAAGAAIATDASDAGPDVGWVYDESSGALRAAVPHDKAARMGFVPRSASAGHTSEYVVTY